MMVSKGRDFAYSLIDQAAISGTNFLMIALGAHYLDLGDQGKLVYVYTGYVGLVLLNVSAYFSVANIVCAETESPVAYRSALVTAQVISSVLSALVVVAGFLLFQKALGWELSPAETALLTAFLVSQQYCDHSRREGYVFREIRRSAYQSLWINGTRLVLLILIQPGTLTVFLGVLLLSSLPIALRLLCVCLTNSRVVDTVSQKNMLRQHFQLAKWNLLGAPLRWFGLHLPILLVGALHSVEAAAILGSIRALTTFVNVLFEMLETFVPAWLAGKREGGEAALKTGSLRLLFIGLFIWLAGLLVFLWLGQAIVDLLLGTSYAQYADMLLILWGGNGVYFIGRVMTLHFRMKKNTRIEFISLSLGIVALVVAIPLIIHFGAWGGAWSLLIIQLATLAGMLMNGHGSGSSAIQGQ
jgi:O-antigen/teichoic acid export membrane protein